MNSFAAARQRLVTFPSTAALLAGLCLCALTAHAQFLWTGNPASSGSGEWGEHADWNGGPVPEFFSDTAIFNAHPHTTPQDVSLTGGTGSPFNIGVVTISANVQDSILFHSGVLNLGGSTPLIDVQTSAPVDFAADSGLDLFGDATFTTGPADSSLTIDGTITSSTGAFGFTKTGLGTVTLNGPNSYSGPTVVSAGTLQINGNQSTATGAVTVATDATLSGTGITGGNVTVVSGGHLVGVQGTTLTMNGLTLNPGAQVDVTLATPSTQALFNINGNGGVPGAGNLALAGNLNVTAVGTFGPGTYRIMDYTGSLTANTMTLGTVPPDFTANVDLLLQTSVLHQVNLINNLGGGPLTFWDGNNPALFDNGEVNGGSGTWRSASIPSWTNSAGTVNATWEENGFAIFQAVPGTVTVDNIDGPVRFSGAQFAVDGYTITGQPLTTDSAVTIIRVGDGTTAGAGMTATINAVIQGSGGLEKTDLGRLILSATNTYGGGTTITNGVLQIGSGGTSGSVIGDVLDNSVLAISRSDNITQNDVVEGLITGSGALEQLGPGTLALGPDNTFTGPTIITGGILSISSGADLGTSSTLVFNGGTALLTTGNVTTSIPVILAKNGTIDNGGNTDVFSGILSGPGRLTSTGSGQLTLTSDNIFTGGTTIASGVLQLGDGTGPTGNIIGDVEDNGTLVFNRIGDTKKTFDGVISGSGSVVKRGSDVLELTANNSFTGGLTISDGVLVAGIPAGSTQTTSLALGMGDVFLQAGVLRAPTLDPIVISVAKNFVIGSAGQLQLGIGGVLGRDYDHVLVGNDASIDGTLSVFSLNFRPVAGNAFMIVHSGGSRTGQFGTINDFLNNNPGLQRVNIYAGNAVILLYLAAIQPPGPTAPPPPPPPPPGPVLPPGGGHVPPTPPAINVVTPIRVPPPDPNQPLALPNLVPLLNPDVEQLTALYQAGFSTAQIQNSILNDHLGQLRRSYVPPSPPPVLPPTGKEVVTGKETKEVAPPPAPSTPRWNLWVSGYGNWVHVDSTSIAQGYHFTIAGMSAGIDYLITPQLVVGIFGGYSHDFVDFKSNGSADADEGHGGIYASYWSPTGWWVNAAVYGGGASYSSSRAALLGQANGSTNGYQFSTYGESGYDFHALNNDLVWGPFVSMSYSEVHVDGFTETGSLVPLNVHADTFESLESSVGAQAYYNLHVGKFLLTPGLKLGWGHEYKYSVLSIHSSVPALGGARGVLDGPNIGHDWLSIEAGAGLRINDRMSVIINYVGQLAREHSTSNAVTGVFSWSF